MSGAAAARPPRGLMTTYLEMNAPQEDAPASLPEGSFILRAAPPSLAFYRFLYNGVGEAHNWVDRRALTDEALAALVCAPEVYVYVLYHRGNPAGFIELDARRLPDVQIVYFGLMPDAVGKGMGRAFLQAGVRAAWDLRPARVWVHTCSEDHPAALPLYEKVGFRRYREEVS